MNNNLQPHKVGLAFGILVALLHVMWSLFVWLGFAGPFIKFVYGLHMLEMPMTVLPFSFVTAIELILLAGVVWYVVGQVFARIWNFVQGS